jgi:2-polyprenyl-3-methyl-5-hydroxy-6-metoxy-1,4-benzoquinol methylase
MKLYERRAQCVLCGSAELDEVVPLEPMPIATPNFHVAASSDDAAFREGVPLGIHQCRACGHLQVIYFGNPELQYRDYVYTTAISLGLPEHFRVYAAEIATTLGLPPAGLVVEIGSNDGTLLRAFRAAGMRVLGIDPARRIAETATASGVQTLPEFFSAALAERIAREHGRATLIVANNVIANVEGMADFADGIAALLDADGVFVFETQYGADVIEHNLLDTVYHEHISYFLLKPLATFFAAHGLELFDAVRVPTKGGSFRAFVQRAGGARPRAPGLRELIEREARQGMFAAAFYQRLSHELAGIRAELRALVDAARKRGEGVAGYGVSVGTTTLLAQFGLTRDIDFLVDDAPGKAAELVGPDYAIPVTGREALLARRPGIVIVFAWRYADPIAAKNQAYLAAGGAFVVPLPHVTVRRAEKAVAPGSS